jgi:hypothetical protein
MEKQRRSVDAAQRNTLHFLQYVEIEHFTFASGQSHGPGGRT